MILKPNDYFNNIFISIKIDTKFKKIEIGLEPLH